MTVEQKFFQNKKNVISFILSLLVFFIHFRVFSVFRNAEGLLAHCLDNLLAFTKVAVPLFFMISGALFYRNYKITSTLNKWKNRIKSLFIPYIIWNTIWLFLALLGNYTPLGALLGGVKATFTPENILRGIFLYGYFEPFWFLFQLIVLTLFCPLIYLILKNKYIGFIAISAFFCAKCFGFKPNTTLFPNSDMILPYLIGAWIGIHHFTFFIKRKSKCQSFIAFIIYLLCCTFHHVTNLLPLWCETFQFPLLVTIISCFAFWTFFDFFDMRKSYLFTSFSFLIYALHSFVGATLSKVLVMLLPPFHGSLSLIAIVTFPATIMIICIVGIILEKHFPRLKLFLTGR